MQPLQERTFDRLWHARLLSGAAGYWPRLLRHPPRFGQLAHWLPALHLDSGTCDSVSRTFAKPDDEATLANSDDSLTRDFKALSLLGGVDSKQRASMASEESLLPTAACKRAADAAAAIEQVAAHGESFADHLAATRQSHQSHPIRDGALAAFAAYMVADTPLPYVSSTDVSCDVGTHEVAGAGAAIGRAADEHDKWEAASSLGKRSSDDVTEHSKGHGQ